MPGGIPARPISSPAQRLHRTEGDADPRMARVSGCLRVCRHQAPGGYLRRDARSLRASGGPNIASDLPSQLGCGLGRSTIAGRSRPRRSGDRQPARLRDHPRHSPAGANRTRSSTNWTIGARPTSTCPSTSRWPRPGAVWHYLGCAAPRERRLRVAGHPRTGHVPPRHSMRLIRRFLVHRSAPSVCRANTISVCMEHLQSAGATFVEAAGFALSNGIAYVDLGLRRGPRSRSVRPALTVPGLRHARPGHRRRRSPRPATQARVARIMKERFGGPSDRTCMMRGSEQAWCPASVDPQGSADPERRPGPLSPA